MGINYKSVYRVLKTRYPSIADELTKEPKGEDLNRITAIFERYKAIKGIEDIPRNNSFDRLVFIAIVIKIYDPQFLIDQNKRLLHGIRPELTQILQCHETWISHNLRTIKTYMRTYQAFRNEVERLYPLVLSEDERKNYSLF